MKLSDFFSPNNRIHNGKEQVASTKTESENHEALNRQIRALKPGNLIQGEVVERSGGEVKIKLATDMVMTARLDQDVNVEQGSILTFQVKNNGSVLSLSPLFANTATADNLFKALQMANLPINQTTVNMTEQMMQQGMSIDSKSLQNMFRDVALHQNADVSDVVQLHQLGIPVTEESIAQISNYKALTHELLLGMTDVVAELSTFFESGTAGEGEMLPQLAEVLQALLPADEAAVMLNQTDQVSLQGQIPLTQSGEESMVTAGQTGQTGADVVIETAVENLAAKITTLLQENGLKPEDFPELAKLLDQVKEGTATPKEVLQTIAHLAEESVPAGNEAVAGTDGDVITNAGEQVAVSAQTESDAGVTTVPLEQTVELTNGEVLAKVIKDIVKEPSFKELLQNEVLKQWTLEPEKGMDAKTVERVYERLDRQLAAVQDALQSKGGETLKSVTNLRQNLDFMNQLNQMYTYVQLPLTMSGRQANGELYVFTNKRSLAKKDGTVSALLHLDMENLGPVDVYVAMQNERVNTRFTVSDDSMLDFLNEHMHVLTERLEKKGYAMQCELSVREDAEAERTPIERILQKENGRSIAQYGFDVRA